MYVCIIKYMCPRYPWEKQATATQRDSVRQLLELMSEPSTATIEEEVGPTSTSLALVSATVSFGSSRDSQESATVPEPIVRDHSFMEGGENMAIQALQLAMQDSPPSQKLKTAAFQARGGGQVGFIICFSPLQVLHVPCIAFF